MNRSSDAMCSNKRVRVHKVQEIDSQLTESPRQKWSVFLVVMVGLWLTACATVPETLPRTSATRVMASDAVVGQPVLGGDGQVSAFDVSAPVFEPQSILPGMQATVEFGTGRMIAEPRSFNFGLPDGEAVSLQFEQAPVAEVVHAIFGDLLKQPYVVGPGVTGHLTLHTHEPISRHQAPALLETALRGTGLALGRDAQGVFYVGRTENARGVSPELAYMRSPEFGGGTVIVPLAYIGAPEMADILGPVSRPENLLRVDAVRNLLVLTGSRAEIEGWLELVRTFDVDIMKGMSIGLFPLRFVSASEVESGLNAIFTDANPRARETSLSRIRDPQVGEAAPQTAQMQVPGPLAGAFRLVSIERLNAILVVTPRPHYLEIVRQWIERFDQPRRGGNEQLLFVYPVRNGSAQHIGELLTKLFEQQGRTPGREGSAVAPGLTATRLESGQEPDAPIDASAMSRIRVVADERNNALVILASPAEYLYVEAAIRRLDLAPKQVLIEASIFEVSLSDELRYGLQWYFNNGLGSGHTGVGQLLGGTSATLAAPAPGFAYSIVNSSGQVRAVLSALSNKTGIHVISSPSVLVQDNQTATIQVGDQQPVRSSTTITDGGTTTSSIEYKDTGVNLSVTPLVNAGGMVSLDLKQSITDVGAVDTATGQRSFMKREVSSKVTVRSGESIVLGGLMRDNQSTGRQGVPVLADVPVVGALFSSRNQNSSRTELLIMITPRVIESQAQLLSVTEEMRERFQGALGHLRGWRQDEGAID